MHPSVRPAEAWPELPYPGTRPDGSWVMDAAGLVHTIVPSPDRASGWIVISTGLCLDQWLADRGASTLAERSRVLSYGSNANPVKARQLPGTVINLASTVDGFATVWCAGLRRRGDVPCTLAPMRGAHEHHPVTLVTPEQLSTLDDVEGHPVRYRCETLPAGSVTLADGTRPTVSAYLGIAAARLPLLVDGHPLRVARVDQAVAYRHVLDAQYDTGE